MTDAIQVKAQKGTHQSSEGGACVDGHKHNKKVKRISTEMMLLESRDGSFRHLCGGLDETVNLQELARSHLRREWVPNAGLVPPRKAHLPAAFYGGVLIKATGADAEESAVVVVAGECRPGTVVSWRS